MKLKKKWYKRYKLLSFETDIIAKEGRVIVEQIIREYLLENRDETISVLRAKVFAYEKIISNSNFAPILEGNKAT